MSGLQPPDGTPDVPQTGDLGLRRHLLDLDNEKTAVLRDLLCVARGLCLAEAAYVSVFLDHKEALIVRVGALPKEIPFRAADFRSFLQKNPLFETCDLLQRSEPGLAVLMESPWYYRFCTILPLMMGGALIGAFGVLDRKPRKDHLSDAATSALRALARSLASTLTRSASPSRPVRPSEPSATPRHPPMRKNEDVNKGAAAAQRVNRNGLVGFFEADVQNGTVRISPSLCRMLSLQERDIFPISTIRPCIPRSPSRRNLLDGLGLHDGATLDYKIRLGGVVTERPRWLQCRVALVKGEDAHAAHLCGIVSDASDHDTTVRHYDLLALLGKELRLAHQAVDAYRIAARHLGESLDVDYVQCFHFDTHTGQKSHDYGGWSRRGVAEMPDVPLQGQRIWQYLSRGMVLAIGDLKEVSWLLPKAQHVPADGPRAYLMIPTIGNDRLKHCVVIASSRPRVWRVADTYFTRIVVDWVEAVSNLTEARLGQEFLYREMAHRLKNTLTIVQALARQSLRDCRDQASVRSFERRVHALASANTTSMARKSKKAELKDVAQDVLKLIAPLTRFELNGARVALGAKTAGYLGLLLNELGTNAIKYGALSNEAGKVRLSWVVEGAEEDARLVIRWVETGGPRVKAPLRKGFGSQMIEYGLGEGCHATLSFPQTGCQASFSMSMRKAGED